MGAVLAKDVLRQVSLTLSDINPQFTRWTEQELVAWLNEAQRVVVKYLPYANARVDASKLRPGTRQSIAHILPADMRAGDGQAPSTPVVGTAMQAVICNMGADGQTPGRAIRLVDKDMLDAVEPNWHRATGKAVTQYVYDPRQPQMFYVTPGVPANTDVWVQVDYVAEPTPLPVPETGKSLYAASGTSQQALSLDDRFSDDIFNYVMARAYMKDAEVAANAGLMAAHVNLFTASINAQSNSVLGINPNLKALPMMATPAAAASK